MVLIVAAAVIVSRFAPDVGLARPGDATRAVVADVASVEAVLAEDRGLQAVGEALRAAQASRHTCPVRNTADGRVLHLVDGALDAYSAYREAWQADLEGSWDSETLGDPVYWRASHPDLEFAPAADPLTAAQVRDVARERARELLSQALDEAER